MSVADRWHTRKPRVVDGVPVEPCRQHDLYPSTEHGRGDRWQVRWRDLDDKQCSANRPKKTGKDPAVAAEALDAKVRRELDTGLYVPPDAGAVTLETYGRQWEAGQTSDYTSREVVAQRLRSWVYPTLGKRRMAVLATRPSMVQQWIKGMEADGLGASTIGVIAGLVSSIFLAAIDDGLVTRNPVQAKSVRLPKPPERKIVPWTLPTLRKVRGNLPPRYRAMVDLGAGCGLRQGEILGIGADDVQFLARNVSVRRQIRVVNGKPCFAPPKGGKTRDVPLEDAVGLALSAHMADVKPVAVTLPWRHPDGEPVTVRLLFTTPSGTALASSNLNRAWRDARGDLGDGMHILRHTFASACLAEGVDVRTLAEFLGHANPAFTLQVYSHLMPDAGDRTRRAIGRFFAGELSPASALDVPSEGVR